MATPHIAGNGEYDLEIVGESYYQDALVRIAGRHTAKGRRVECEAELYLEPNNQYDRNAIRVEIQGAPVGHIARELAPEMREELAKLGIRTGQRVKVDAVILGGRTGESYGVWLDVPVRDDSEDDEEEEENEENEENEDGEDGEESPVAAYQPPPVRIVPTAVGSAAPVGWDPPVRNPVEQRREQVPAVAKPARGTGCLWLVGMLFIIVVVAVAAAPHVWRQQPAVASAPSATTVATRADIVVPTPARARIVVPTPTPDEGDALYVTLTCVDCAADNTEANIWSASLAFVVCRLPWGEQVERLQHRQENGGMSQVRSGSCQGWIRDSLIR